MSSLLIDAVSIQIKHFIEVIFLSFVITNKCGSDSAIINDLAFKSTNLHFILGRGQAKRDGVMSQICFVSLL